MGYVRKIPCAKVGCLNFAEKGSMYCSEHIPPKQYNRDNSSKYKYMYKGKWEKARKEFLVANMYCVECKKQGKLTLADTVHHVIEHKGDWKLFWDRSNWVAICSSCHSRIHSHNMQKGKK